MDSRNIRRSDWIAGLGLISLLVQAFALWGKLSSFEQHTDDRLIVIEHTLNQITTITVRGSGGQ